MIDPSWQVGQLLGELVLPVLIGLGLLMAAVDLAHWFKGGK
jgi:hypothetical protein